ncbi:ras and EF-hand domain-containing protein homolog isoform X6 [Rhopilema esculentum]|uniref:ras and EF-hand domain-containing protein homolog isoform X6 n=1 Tax=Rhopilema esculentum TaxID=499914 RepID=UPI0031DB6AB9
MSLDIQQGDVKELFEACDLDASGFIDRHELAAVVDLDPEDLREIFEQFDVDEDGRISIEEFTENFNKFKSLAAHLEKESDLDSSQGDDENVKKNSDVKTSDRTRPRQFTFDRGKVTLKSKMICGQEYLDDIYEAINEMGNPKLLEALESFITTTSDTLSQKNRENERLDTALRRATEKNSENARNLEEEMEQQITMLEEKIREEEKRRAERAIMEAQIKIEEKDKEMKEIKEKLEERMNSQATTKENESEEDLKEKDLENEALRSKLRECQTQMAVFRTEIAQLKNEYDEQGERLSRERQTVLRCVHEQESLTRQLQLLHEANRKLHDTNDDLRAALENRLRSSDDSMSPSKRNSFVGSPIGAYKKNPLSRSFDNQSTDSSRSAVTSPIMNGGDELSTMSTPPFRPLESEFNESSLMSELMAADEQGDGDDDIETEGILNTSMGLPEGILPLHNIETDYVDDDAETDPEFVENEKLKEAFKNMTGKELENESLQAMPAKEKEQMMEQLRILCETNRRLSQCNDELRDALGLLSKKRKDKKSPRSSSRSSHSDYMSSPSRSNSRSSSINSRNSIPDRPPSSSSPRKRRSNSRKPSHSATDESASDITSGINSSYSVIQNIDEELSMFAHQRESDEDVDEDDMTIGELQRIKEMTSSGSDLESDTDSTFGEKQRQGDLDTTDQNSNENLGEPERMYKLVLAGDAAVGKSSFILRLCKNRFYPSLNSTLGVDFQMKTLNVDGHTIALQLWDTAGQERFRSIAKSYFRRVDGVLLLYDVTSEQSFLNVRDWMESIQESSNKPVPIMLCGNKIDLRKPTAPNGKSYISREQGERLAKEIDAFFIETSSRKNTNIAEAVLKLARKLRSLEDTEIRNGGMTLGDNGNDKKKSGCC